SRVLIPVGAAVLIGALAPGALAQAAPISHANVASGSSAAQSVRSIVRRASLTSLSHAIGQLPRGTKGPEVAPSGRAAITTRSHSRRPDPRALAAAAGPLEPPVVQSTSVL